MFDSTSLFGDISWLNLIFTILVAVISLTLSFYGIKRYIASAERERLKRAKNDLVDIMEGWIINKNTIFLRYYI